MDVYEQLKEKALPFIEDYKDDLLVHDKDELERHKPGTPFLHFTGSTGTAIEVLQDESEYPKKGERVPYLFATANREHILDQKVKVVDCTMKVNRHDLILYYPGGDKNIETITHDRAKEIIREYWQDIKDIWIWGDEH